jgi:hypothetical protein
LREKKYFHIHTFYYFEYMGILLKSQKIDFYSKKWPCELILGCNPPINWALLIEAEVDIEKELKYEFLTFLLIREHL